MKTSPSRILRAALLLGGLALGSFATAQAVPSALQGIWRSDGYGWILQVSGNQITRYHESSAGLIIGTDTAAELRGEFNTATALNATTLTAGNITEGSLYRFTRLDNVPGGAIQPGTGSAAQTVEFAIAYLQDHYGFTTERGIDWPARFAAARTAVNGSSNASTLRAALLNLIDGTTDAHLRLLWEHNDNLASGPDFNSRVTVPLIETQHLGSGATRQARYDDWRLNRIINHINHLIDLGGAGAAGGAVMWHRSGNTGYLFIADMFGYTPVDSVAADVEEINTILDLALTQLAGVQDLVIDLTLNGGGRDAVGRAIAARFTDAPLEIYTKQPVEGSNDARQTFSITPTSRPSFHGKVHVVTSDLTVSAAETFTLAMRALPNVRLFGMTTHGSLSDMLIKPLPNGWALALSNERYTDSAGQQWEGSGIVPHTELPIFTAGTIGQSHFERIMSFATAFVHEPLPEPEPEPAPEPTPEPQPAPHLEPAVAGLFNLSTRGLVGTGNATLISGLIIDGDGTRDLAITGRGPSLTAAGLSGAVANVKLRVLNETFEVIATADSLADLPAADRAELAAYGILPTDAAETAVILRNLPAGAYHIHLSAEDADPGVGILEVFDISTDDSDGTTLFNLSSRVEVGDGEAVAITGFIITGEEEVGVLIRGQGPTLRQYGIENALENPSLRLLTMGGTEVLANNLDYTDLDADLRAALDADGIAPGDPSEAILILSLPPGAYTAMLDAEPGSDLGIGLIEFFRLDD